MSYHLAVMDTQIATVEIYALTDPRIGDVRYIGKAKCAAKRLKTHIREARRRRTPVYDWIRKLAAEGVAPAVTVIETVAESDWREAEVRIIAAARSASDRLLNVADGGDEPFCSIEVRRANGRNNALARARDPLKRRVWELKHALSEGLRRGELSEEVKAKMRLAAAKAPHLFGQWAAI